MTGVWGGGVTELLLLQELETSVPTSATEEEGRAEG